jgi:hypothetical protein
LVFLLPFLLDIRLILINVYAYSNTDENLVAEICSQLGDKKKGQR